MFQEYQNNIACQHCKNIICDLGAMALSSIKHSKWKNLFLDLRDV